MRTLILKIKICNQFWSRDSRTESNCAALMTKDTIMRSGRGGKEEELHNLLPLHLEDKNFIKPNVTNHNLLGPLKNTSHLSIKEH